MSSSGQASWLQVAAAFGTLVSLFTLLLTIVFRVRDSRTRLKLTYSLGDPESPADRNLLQLQLPQERAIFFRIRNASRTDILLTDIYLELSGEHRMDLPHLVNLTVPSQSPPGFVAVGYHPLRALATTLKEEGYAGTTHFKLVVYDGTGRSHKKQVEIPDLFSAPNTAESPRSP